MSDLPPDQPDDDTEKKEKLRGLNRDRPPGMEAYSAQSTLFNNFAVETALIDLLGAEDRNQMRAVMAKLGADYRDKVQRDRDRSKNAAGRKQQAVLALIVAAVTALFGTFYAYLTSHLWSK